MKSRLIVVSNRLPVTLEDGPGGITVQPSCGGLVSALLPVFKEMGGCWIGWPGSADCESRVAEVLRHECEPEYSLEPVYLSSKDRALFYQGCSNEIIWPLFHDLQSRCRFEPSFWTSYCEVNGKYADSVQRIATNDDFVWVHDYHLMMVGQILRERGVELNLAYFHHVPFPSPDIFEKIPWRRQLIEGLLNFNTIGFQSDRDRRNFVACVKRELRDVKVRRFGGLYELKRGDSSVLIGSFPISIDFHSYTEAARMDEVTKLCNQVKAQCDDRKIILGVDRLDYTKGISERLLAFALLLKRRPDLWKKLTMIQVVVPSRVGIQNYAELRSEIERRVSEINGEFGSPDWCPITYLHKSVSSDELLGLYRAADVMLVTPLKDGMNLVAKEYCASRNDNSGVLVLSEFAGAAAELRSGAILVNPYDSIAVADAISRAIALDESSKQRRMRNMRGQIRANDVFAWCESFRDAALNTAEQPPLEIQNVQRLMAKAM